MKVAFYADSLLQKPYAGVSVYAHYLVKELARNLDVTLIFTDLPAKNRYHDIPSISYRFWRFPIVIRKVRDFLLKRVMCRFDIFHDPGNYNIPLGRARCLTVLTLHDVSAFEYPDFFQHWHVKAYHEYLPKALKTVDAIITVSDLQKKKITRYYQYPKERIFVIPLGIDSELFHPLNGEDPIGKPYLLYVGSIQPRKGLKELLEAFRLIKDRIPHVLCIVGGGWHGQEKEIHVLVKELNIKEKVIFTGMILQHDLPAYYSNAALSLHVTHNDSFGIPILESLACGTPVIASDIEGLRSAHPEGVLFYVDQTTPQSIAEAIIELLEDSALYFSFKSKGMDYASNRTWQKVAHETIGVYKTVMELGHI